jgi:hypothetical protein
VLVALPLLALSFFARTVFNNILAQSLLQSKVAEALGSGQIQYDGQSWTIPTQVNPFNLLVTAFSPALLNIDPPQREQATTFLIDLAPVWLVFILESHRRANFFKFLFTLPVMYGIAFQMLGIGIVGPIWFFVHYIQSPLADYAAKDWRLVNVAAAKTALLAIVVAFVMPTLAMYHLPDMNQRLTVNTVWQAFPVISVGLHYILRKVFVEDTTMHDRVYNVEGDMRYIRTAVWILAGISGVIFNAIRFSSTVSISEIFFPSMALLKSITLSGAGSLDLVSGMRLFLQVDEMVCFAAAFLWLALLIRDLKDAEMTSVSWVKAVSAAAGGVYLVGPGAVVALAWWWRENILAVKHAKGSAGPRT